MSSEDFLEHDRRCQLATLSIKSFCKSKLCCLNYIFRGIKIFSIGLSKRKTRSEHEISRNEGSEQLVKSKY